MKNKDTPERRKYLKDYRERNREKLLKRTRDFQVARRRFILESLGNKCSCCGFDDVRALQIDHINSGGVKEISSFGCYSRYATSLYKMLNEDREVFLLKFQLLCANCNWIKRHTNNEFSQ